MAKIGEGDPRWIVSERADGANVNSWHWQERDLQSVAHDAIKAAFKDKLLCSEGDMTLAIKEVSEISGDVTVAQRKGKIMCYFELKLALKYSGTVGDSAVEGKITIPEVDHDTFREDYEITVSAADRTAANQKAEQWVQKGGRVAVRKVIADYFEALYAEYKVGTNVKTGTPVSLPSAKPAASPAAAAAAASPKPAAAAASASALTSFTQVLEWRAPINDLWTILTDAGRATAYTRAPAQLNVQPGGDFSFLGGAMTGHYVTVEHPTKLAMQWRLSNWPSNVFSSVVLLLRKEEAGMTRLELAQSGVPEGEVERVRAGWQCNFWDPIKALFGLTYEQK